MHLACNMMQAHTKLKQPPPIGRSAVRLKYGMLARNRLSKPPTKYPAACSLFVFRTGDCNLTQHPAQLPARWRTLSSNQTAVMRKNTTRHDECACLDILHSCPCSSEPIQHVAGGNLAQHHRTTWRSCTASQSLVIARCATTLDLDPFLSNHTVEASTGLHTTPFAGPSVNTAFLINVSAAKSLPSPTPFLPNPVAPP